MRSKAPAAIFAASDASTTRRRKTNCGGSHDGGIRGVRFNLLDRPRGNVKLDVLDRCVENIVELGWSVDLHIDMKNLLEQEKRIRNLPLPVVIDHIARVKPAEGLNQRGFQLLLDLIKLKHVWVKVSGADKICNTRVRFYFGLPFVEVIPYAQAVIAAAPDRIIWGTDWPHSNNFAPGHTPNDGDLVDLLAAFAPDEADEKKTSRRQPGAFVRLRISAKNLPPNKDKEQA